MQLRDHPIFTIRNIGCWWPPVWVNSRKNHRHVLHGEVGTLVDTMIHEDLPNRLFMKTEHDDERFLGVLVVSDVSLCLQLHKLLQQKLGASIEEIGDLEIDFLF